MGLQDVFSAIGRGLKAAAPYFQPVADHLAAAAGNYKPLLNSQTMAQQQREFGIQKSLADSTLATNALNQTRLGNENDNYLDPQAKADLEVSTEGRKEQQKYTNAPPPVISGYTGDGNVGNFERDYDKASNTWKTKPLMVSPPDQPAPAPPNPANTPGIPTLLRRPDDATAATPDPATQPHQLMAMPKTSKGQPVADGKGGFIVPIYDAMNRVSRYEKLDGTPLTMIPKVENKSGESIQKDVNGNLVSVPTHGSKTTGPAIPGGGQSTLPPVPQSGGAPPPVVGPPVPGATRPQVGGGQRARPILGPDGDQMHAPLSAPAKKTLQQISTSDQMLNSVLPDLTKAVAEIGHGSNLYDAGKTKDSWIEYSHGLDPNNIDPNSPVAALPGADPRITKMFPALAMMKVVLAQPFMNNSRNFSFMQQIQQHIPDPERDTPQLMLSKAQWIKQAMPMIKKSVYDSEGIGTGVQNTPQQATPQLSNFHTNPKTGERIGWDGKAWVPAPKLTQ